MKYKYVITILVFVTVGIYLFVSAPPLLTNEHTNARKIPIKTVLALINNENKVARSIYTKMIVKPGKKAGLNYAENWKEVNIDAGPLPAQFLRLTAIALENSKIPLGLYLGSDYPISAENRLEGVQRSEFETIKKTRLPRFFYTTSIQRYTFMYPDIAISDICVSCHNDHKDTTKKDWRINEVMGATTWTYPDEFVSLEQAIEMVSIFRSSIFGAYSRYIDKTKLFKKPPILGEQWPDDGYYLPSPSVFMQELSDRASPQSIEVLYNLAADKPANNAAKKEV